MRCSAVDHSPCEMCSGAVVPRPWAQRVALSQGSPDHAQDHRCSAHWCARCDARGLVHSDRSMHRSYGNLQGVRGRQSATPPNLPRRAGRRFRSRWVGVIDRLHPIVMPGPLWIWRCAGAPGGLRGAQRADKPGACFARGRVCPWSGALPRPDWDLGRAHPPRGDPWLAGASLRQGQFIWLPGE
jgi:hypothetical protein